MVINVFFFFLINLFLIFYRNITHILGDFCFSKRENLIKKSHCLSMFRKEFFFNVYVKNKDKLLSKISIHMFQLNTSNSKLECFLVKHC